MEVSRKLNVPASHVYSCILDSVQYDITQQTGKSIPSSQLVGFKYDKKIGQNQQMTVEILALEPEKTYHFSTTTPTNTFNSLYKITALDEKSCKVHYKETVISHGAIQKMNDMLVGMIFNLLKKKQVKQLLHGIESSGLSHAQS